MKYQKLVIPAFLFLTFQTSLLAKDRLTNDTIRLKPVVATGIQLPTKISELPSSVTIISREEIEKTEASSVLSSLKGLVPGLFITERSTTGYGIFSGSGGGISLRGIGGSPTTEVLIAIDGHPQIMGINGHNLPDAYVSYNAESIEILRGPASTVYGSNAMGGVINIITREEKTDGFKANGSMMLGSFNTQKYMLSLSSKKDRLSGFFSTNFDRTDGHRAHSAFNLFNAFGKVGYKLTENLKASADFSLSDYRSTDPGPIVKPATSDSLTADVTRGMASLNLDNTFEKTSGKVKLYYDFGHNEIYNGWKSDDINAGLMADQSINPWNGSVFTLGLDCKLYGGQASWIDSHNPNPTLDKTFNETAIYLIGRQSVLNDKLTLDAGMRLNMNSFFGDEWVPRIGLVFKPVETSVFKLSTARGFRNPTMRELFINLANEDLKPESMMNYEVSYTQFSTDKRLTGEIAAYLSKGENMIQIIMNGGIPKYFNTGTFNNKGLELALQYNFPISLNVHTNYSYTHCEKPILATPEHQINAGADYSLGKLNVMMNLQQIQNYYLNVSNGNVKENFTLLDAKIGYQISKKLSVFCKADNLLSSDYQMNYNYPMPGIIVMGGLKVSL